MKQLFALLLALSLLLTLTACGSSPGGGRDRDGGGSGALRFSGPAPEERLVQIGAAQSRLMGELAADRNYAEAMGATDFLIEVLDEIRASRYEAPYYAVLIPVPENVLSSLAREYGLSLDVEQAVRDVMERRLSTSVGNLLAGQSGAYYVAAASFFTLTESYRNPGLEQNALLFLYYEDVGFCTLTTFVLSQEDTVLTYTAFVPTAGLDPDPYTREGILDTLRELGVLSDNITRYEGEELAALLG